MVAVTGRTTMVIVTGDCEITTVAVTSGCEK